MKKSKLSMAIAKTIAIGIRSQCLLLIATMVLALTTSCQKDETNVSILNDAKLVTFTIDMGFNMTSSSKALGDSIFDTFEHQFAPTADTYFTAEDGTVYHQLADYRLTTIKTATYRLPVGVYSVGGGAGIQVFNCMLYVLDYSVPDQKVTIKEDTKIVPVILNPDSYLILVADPYHQVDTTTSKLTNVHFIYNGGNTYVLKRFKQLKYIYGEASSPRGSDSGLGFTKWDGSVVFINADNFTRKHIYKIMITKKPLPSTITTPQAIPSFIVDSVKIY